MYMAYGWPQVIPVNTGVRSSASYSDAGGIFADRIIYLKIINRLLLLVTPTHLQLWSCSQHKVRIGKYMRDADSVKQEGENLQAIWSPDTKTIAVLVEFLFMDGLTGHLLQEDVPWCMLFADDILLVDKRKSPGKT